MIKLTEVTSSAAPLRRVPVSTNKPLRATRETRTVFGRSQKSKGQAASSAVQDSRRPREAVKDAPEVSVAQPLDFSFAESPSDVQVRFEEGLSRGVLDLSPLVLEETSQIVGPAKVKDRENETSNRTTEETPSEVQSLEVIENIVNKPIVSEAIGSKSQSRDSSKVRGKDASTVEAQFSEIVKKLVPRVTSSDRVNTLVRLDRAKLQLQELLEDFQVRVN
jgi:hypothetical protein